jgi:hypothetical protein
MNAGKRKESNLENIMQRQKKIKTTLNGFENWLSQFGN